MQKILIVGNNDLPRETYKKIFANARFEVLILPLFDVPLSYS